MLLLVICILFSMVILTAIFRRNRHLSFNFQSFLDIIYFGGSVLLVLSIIISLCILLRIQCVESYPSQIQVYRTANRIIEEEIAESIKGFQIYNDNYPSDFFEDDEVNAIFKIPPELKSDQFISVQIDNYLANENRIKELKVEMSGLSVCRFWLYLGE